MKRWVLPLFLAAAGALAAGEPPKPDYLKRKPAPKQEQKDSKTLPPVPKDDGEPREVSLPPVAEMKVERSNSGGEVSANKPVVKPPSAVHGDLRTSGSQDVKNASGTAVVQDKKSGKWAVTVSGDKTKIQ